MAATEIRLLGTLGKRYGRTHFVHLDTKTPAEAGAWLCSQFPAARDFLVNAASKGIEFAVFRGRGAHRENIGIEQLKEPGGDCITFAPIHVGSKSGGALTTIVGAVLVVIGFAISGFSFGTLSPLGAIFVTAGIGMIAGGVVQMLSPQPKAGKNGEAADNQSSYIFSGPVNTTAQGGCVPVIYGGPIEVGSAVISAGIEAVDYSSRPSNVGAGSTLGNAKTSPYDPD